VKGSIKQDKYGWFFVISDGTYPNGKRKQVKRTGFTTHEEAEIALNEMKIELQKVNQLKKQMDKWTDIGHAGEKIVLADLILKNFFPFTAELPSSTVDLIALKNNITYRIQVKTSTFDDYGKMKVGNLDKYSKDQFDILAVVDLKSKNIAYIKWSDINNKTMITLHNRKQEGEPYFYQFGYFPE
jgi:hypothetical protein